MILSLSLLFWIYIFPEMPVDSNLKAESINIVGRQIHLDASLVGLVLSLYYSL